MNLHPLFTHFPVALLTLYSLLELMRFKKILAQPYIFYVKAVFVICGTGIGYMTFITGYIQRNDFSAEEVVKLVSTHLWSAIITLVIFSLLSLGYVLGWLASTNLLSTTTTSPRCNKIHGFLLTIKRLLLSSPILIIGALCGLIAITITGALGGALAYGRTVDPFVNAVYGFLIAK